MKVIGFVPIKGVSQGLPGKNTKSFCGEPLFYWVGLEMLGCEAIDYVYISSDSPAIEVAISDGLPCWEERLGFFLENEDSRPHWDKSIVEFCEAKNALKSDDILVMAQVTSPFTQVHHIQEALELYKNKNCKGSIVTCAKTHRFIWQKLDPSGSESINYDYRHRPRRQDFGGTLVENGAFCINTVGNILRDKNRLSSPVSIYEMPEWTYTEIDNEDDWCYAEYLFRKYVLKEGT